MLADHIKITRDLTRRRLKLCEVFDAEGNKLCELPITGASVSIAPSYARYGSTEKATIELHSFRVLIVDERIEDLPTEEMEVVT